MLVRIRLGKEPPVSRGRAKKRRIAQAIAVLLKPAALMASVMGLWRITSDFNWTAGFVVPSGLFSYWQVWLGGAALLQLCSHSLNRYGQPHDDLDRVVAEMPLEL
jgi:hypothetical protein